MMDAWSRACAVQRSDIVSSGCVMEVGRGGGRDAGDMQDKTYDVLSGPAGQIERCQQTTTHAHEITNMMDTPSSLLSPSSVAYHHRRGWPFWIKSRSGVKTLRDARITNGARYQQPAASIYFY